MNTEPKLATGEWTEDNVIGHTWQEIVGNHTTALAAERERTEEFARAQAKANARLCEIESEHQKQLADERERFNTQEQQWLSENLRLTDEIQQLRARLAADALAKAGK